MSRRWFVYVPIGLAILALLIWRTRPWEALDAISRASLGWLLVALALDGLMLTAWTMRSRQLLQALGHPIGLTQLAPIVLFANTVAAVTPASLGEALRAVVLRRRHGVPYRVGAAVILVERLVSLYLLVAWTALALAALALPSAARLPFLAVAGAGAALVPIAVARSRAGLAGPLQRAAGLLPVGRDRLRRFAAAAGDVEDLGREVAGSAVEMARFALMTAVALGAGAAQVVAVSLAFGQALDPLVAWAALGSGQLAGILSALPFGLGAADSVIVVGLVAGGLSPAMATVITLSARFLSNLPIALGGLASYFYLAAADDPADAVRSSEIP
jgi:uncharacterized membrane protein YbhN (UPF0104 family)